MTASASLRETPSVWILAGLRGGDKAQMVGLAEALGWRYETKTLAFNRRRRLPLLQLLPTLISLDRPNSSVLAPPWPDLLISSGRISVPVARWIRARSKARTRHVHIGRPWAPLHVFDLVITTPQYRLPQRPNVLQNLMALHRVTVERLASAAAHWSPRFAHLPRPWIAFLVGAKKSPFLLTPDLAAELGADASKFAADKGGSLLVTSSPRTPGPVIDAICNAVSCRSYQYRWQPNDPENPYLGFLALADLFLITGDSASMLSEACSTGRPVSIVPLPKRALWRRFTRRDRSLYAVPRDMDRLHKALISQGLAVPFGDPLPAPTSPRYDDIDGAVARVRALFDLPAEVR